MITWLHDLSPHGRFLNTVKPYGDLLSWSFVISSSRVGDSRSGNVVITICVSNFGTLGRPLHYEFARATVQYTVAANLARILCPGHVSGAWSFQET